MENTQKAESRIRPAEAMDQIDLLKLVRVLWNKLWLMVLVGAIFAAGGYGYSKYYIRPMYSTSAMMYVNNNDISIGDSKLTISSADVYAANSLVENFKVIMKTRTTMEEVIERTGLKYSPAALSSMVSAKAVDETSVLSISVTCPVPEEAQIIANALTDVLPDRVTEIIKGCSVKLVERAALPTARISPNNVKNGIMAGMVGAMIVAGILVLLFLMDDVIHDEDEVKQYYETIPMLGAIPDTAAKHGGYGYGKKSKGKEA